MNELIKEAIPAAIKSGSPEAGMVVLLGAMLLVYLGQKAMENGYEIHLNMDQGLVIKPASVTTNETKAAKQVLKADAILMEMEEQKTPA